jgi:bifunctional DNA-binding transcriptional regulator/antitoxin component of YhaV-PrlF toxin-antitoxin module
MRITSKAKVTIPAKLREQAGLLPDTEVQFELDGGGCGLFGLKVVTAMDRVQRWSLN